MINHWIWERPDYLKAWLFLLTTANYKDKKTVFKGKTISCKRGTVNISISELAREIGWSRPTARKFLELCEKDKMLQVEASKQRTVITITNYEAYQGENIPKEKPTPAKVEKKPKGNIPTLAEVQAVIDERNYHYVKAADFLAYYEGDFPTNWKRVLLTWEKNGEKREANTPKPYKTESQYSQDDVAAAIRAFERGE